MVVDITPSPVLEGVINQLVDAGLVEGIKATEERLTDFRSTLEATLTGIGLDPLARPVADKLLDNAWQAQDTRDVLSLAPGQGEVIVGSGFHAAVYAATRVRMGFPKPFVLERNARPGGVFAMTQRATFNLNSRNRPGGVGLAGDIGASLNHIPGGIIQPASIGMAEYQTNADMAFAIRCTLAQYATVLPGVEVLSIDSDGDLNLSDYGDWYCGRVILARGLGDPVPLPLSPYVVDFPTFMRRMEQPWPMRGLRRVAVIGGGDSGKCAVESVLGIAPQPFMASAALDHVERVDWYSPDVPDTCEDWFTQIRGRYQNIGRFLREDRYGGQRLVVEQRTAQPTPLPDCAVIDGRSYDLVVSCTGNRIKPFPGAVTGSFFTVADERVARYNDETEVYRVGPEAEIPFSDRERDDGLAEVSGNGVAMFRLGTKTAMLAAALPSPTSPF